MRPGHLVTEHVQVADDVLVAEHLHAEDVVALAEAPRHRSHAVEVHAGGSAPGVAVAVQVEAAIVERHRVHRELVQERAEVALVEDPVRAQRAAGVRHVHDGLPHRCAARGVGRQYSGVLVEARGGRRGGVAARVEGRVDVHGPGGIAQGSDDVRGHQRRVERPHHRGGAGDLRRRAGGSPKGQVAEHAGPCQRLDVVADRGYVTTALG